MEVRYCSNFIFSLVYLLCCEFSVSADDKTYYKISMVASETNPKVPAMFVHGTNPVWDERTQSLLLADAASQNLHRLDYDSGKLDTKHIGYGAVNVVLPIVNSRRLLVCVRASVYLMDWDVEGDAALRQFTALDLGLPDNYINVAKVDDVGRLWAGTTTSSKASSAIAQDRGSLYSVLDTEASHPVVRLKPVSSVNGLVWALNNSVLYISDPTTRTVDAFDFESETGAIYNGRTVIDVKALAHGYEDAVPCGMDIDSNGNLWVALTYGGAVLHINPDERHVIYIYKLPVSRATSVVWGGPNLDELFVTTSQIDIDLSAERLAGAIFTIRDTGNTGARHYAFPFEAADKF